MSPPLLASLALVICCVTFALIFRLARRLDNYGVVDIAWSYAFGLVAALYAALASGWAPRRLLVAGLVVVWSLRLGTYLYRRVMSHHPEEDGRYRAMRVRWTDNFAAEMFKFYQFQAVSVVVLALPFLLALGRPEPRFVAMDWIALGLFIIAQCGEALADAQLARFKRAPSNKGKVCNVGLWNYSRHPNYFFEWLIWVAFFVFALGSPHGWIAIIGPASILYLLLRVTGIPLTEEQSLRSKGDAYRRYQQTTSAFVPWPPKPSA